MPMLPFMSVRNPDRDPIRNPILNLFDAIPEHMLNEVTEPLINRQSLRIERIISQGQASPAGFWYDQAEDEWVLLVSGRAGLQFEDETDVRELKSGDHVYIPAHRRHRVAWTDAGSATIWLAVYFAPRA